MSDPVLLPLRVLTACCPICGRIVAAHVITAQKSDAVDLGLIVQKHLRGFAIIVAHSQVDVAPCRCTDADRMARVEQLERL